MCRNPPGRGEILWGGISSKGGGSLHYKIRSGCHRKLGSICGGLNAPPPPGLCSVVPSVGLGSSHPLSFVSASSPTARPGARPKNGRARGGGAAHRGATPLPRAHPMTIPARARAKSARNVLDALGRTRAREPCAGAPRLRVEKPSITTVAMPGPAGKPSAARLGRQGHRGQDQPGGYPRILVPLGFSEVFASGLALRASARRRPDCLGSPFGVALAETLSTLRVLRPHPSRVSAFFLAGGKPPRPRP
jgi:hypothetical protein